MTEPDPIDKELAAMDAAAKAAEEEQRVRFQATLDADGVEATLDEVLADPLAYGYYPVGPDPELHAEIDKRLARIRAARQKEQAAQAMLDLPLEPPPGGQILHQSDLATVIWGDCREPAVVAQVPLDYDLLCTDPPYGMNYKSSYGRNFAAIEGDDGTVDWPAVLGLWARRLRNRRHVYIFGYTGDQLKEPLGLGPTADIVWDKAMRGMGNLSVPWGPAHERITFGVSNINPKHGGKERIGGLTARMRQGSVVRVPRPCATAVTRHPTEKPVPLMAQLIESSTVRGDLVVDPCAGSGSTGVAAVLEGRRCFLVEYDRGYAELAVERVRAAEKIAALIDAA